MIAPFLRIGLRFLAGFLIGRGLADPGAADALWQDEVFIGAVAGLLNEGWYLAARRFGWAT